MTKIRRAQPSEAETLTDIALSSKAVWGYDADFIAQCRDELTIEPDFIAQNDVHVVDVDGYIAGFYALLPPDANTAVLDFLYVHPEFLRRGFGSALWRHAVEKAQQLGAQQIRIDADPNAEPFYQRMGAERIGMAASGSIPGRFIPQMRYEISNSAQYSL